MSEIQEQSGGEQNKRNKNEKEVEASCWNCFTTEDVDKNSGSMKLFEIREEHRKNLKLYPFLVKELSKPKTVPLKQKVSEQYVISKRIDENLAKKMDLVENASKTSNNPSVALNNKVFGDKLNSVNDSTLNNEVTSEEPCRLDADHSILLRNVNVVQDANLTQIKSNTPFPILNACTRESTLGILNETTSIKKEVFQSLDNSDWKDVNKQGNRESQNIKEVLQFQTLNKNYVSLITKKTSNPDFLSIGVDNQTQIGKPLIENKYDSILNDKNIPNNTFSTEKDSRYPHPPEEIYTEYQLSKPGIIVHKYELTKAKPVLKKQMAIEDNQFDNINVDSKKSFMRKYFSSDNTKKQVYPAQNADAFKPIKSTLKKSINMSPIGTSNICKIPINNMNVRNISLPDTTILSVLDERAVLLKQDIGIEKKSNSLSRIYEYPVTDEKGVLPEQDRKLQVSYKVQIETATPINKITFDNNKASDQGLLTNSKTMSWESKEETTLYEKGDNTSFIESESGYTGSSVTVQDLSEEPGTKIGILENHESVIHVPERSSSQVSKHNTNSVESLLSLTKSAKKTILKTSSLTSGMNNAGRKSPIKSLRWSTMSIQPRSFSFEDEVYLSESVSPGHATLPRRSNSPLPHERDLDRDRFPLNRSGLQARSESMASVYSGAGEGMRGNVTIRGEVQFSLLYNYRLGALEVGVKRCRDLAPIDVKRNRSDPYVKVYLLPDKSKAGKRKTKVKKNTLNPVFEETLSFVQPLASLSSRTLWLSAWHADMFGRNDFLGEVTLPLADVVFDDPAPMWYKLHERTEQFDEHQGTRGDLIVGLKFEPDAAARGKGTLHVLVKEAKNLVATKPNGLADVFCKSYLLPERGRMAKQKTGVVRRSLSPRWEHTFTYRGLTPAALAARALELSLWDRDRLASNDFMGAVRLSLGTGTYMGASVNWMDSTGKEVALWQTMMQRPNFWVEGSLPLRPQLNN